MLFGFEIIGVAHLLPRAAHIDLKPRELGLIAHLGAAGHPIAQIYIRQTRRTGDFDVVKDDVIAQPVTGPVRAVERIDHAHPVIEHIRQADANQLAGLGIGIFDHTAADRGFLDHRGEFEDIHIGHATVCMAAVKIGAEEVVLLFRGPRRRCPPRQPRVTLDCALLAFARGEVGYVDARRQTGRAIRARRAIQYILRPPEALPRQAVIQLGRGVALQRGEQFTFHPAVQIRAGLGRSHIELRSDGKCMAHENPLLFGGNSNNWSKARQAQVWVSSRFRHDGSAGLCRGSRRSGSDGARWRRSE